ncbi:ABC transporter [Methylobacterium sp. Leaf469]|jgi:capsular polysaccharide transport system permease protein|uniref:ABC transporter permease n=2 Tax=Methylobacterium TaxID=407 RepID=UPI0006F3FFBC|nr:MULTISPECIES: ABC transporter permease [unclassified Methylobacterium]USU32198.1 ABC transporter permease [Methylobacterium sp. OTU13CASTA1]KQO64022.1 ABC transporter [Methylobacterium sp. Leaf87]KQP33181.1 ABC transporter [Methylobacterium sp. Leaf100]KQP59039.1 ABC transporter [Methylobacterium sp. Leaf112]KQT87855.1 ABC transporter [Methylobacterium sp. Leaf469]
MVTFKAKTHVARSDWEVYAHVIHALMLRDMRTRFGASYWGYVVVILWPVAHIFLIVGLMAFRGMPSPLGDSVILFIATGAVPALVFQYTSREAMKAIVSSKPLTYYPQVKLFDLIVARFIVEAVKGFTGLILIFFILVCFGVDPIPDEPIMAVGGYCAALLLGLGIGAINVGILSFFPGWQIGYILVTITFYLTSGVYFLPQFMPPQIYEIMKWNPMVQIIEWVRLGYYTQLGVNVDYLYVLGMGFGTLTLGLIMERTLVRRLA